MMKWIAPGLLAFAMSATMLHAEAGKVAMYADVYATVDGKEELQGSAKYTKQVWDTKDACEAFRASDEAKASVVRLHDQIVSVYGIEPTIKLRCDLDE